MITIDQILSRCSEEQLENILDSSLSIMKHMEFVSGRTSTQLAIENEQFWKLYGIMPLRSLSWLAEHVANVNKLFHL